MLDEVRQFSAAAKRMQCALDRIAKYLRTQQAQRAHLASLGFAFENGARAVALQRKQAEPKIFAQLDL